MQCWQALKHSMSFFNAERSGALIGNDISWRGDSALADAFVNGSSSLAGGFYDGANGVFSFIHSFIIQVVLGQS